MTKETKKHKKVVEDKQKLNIEQEHLKAWYNKGVDDMKKVYKVLHDIIEMNPLSIQIFDKDGFSISVNAAHTDLFKAVPEKDFCIFTDKQLKEQKLKPYFEELRKGKVVHFPDNRYNAHLLKAEYPDSNVWVSAVAFPIFGQDNKPEQYVIMHKDITANKETEQELHDLAECIQKMIEDEKKAISERIHDEVGQELTAIKLAAEKLALYEQEDEARLTLRKMIKKVNALIDTVRNITDKIRPAIIDDFGIEAAIEWYVQGWKDDCRMKEGCEIVVLTDIDPELALNEKAALHIYRVLQESLTNICRHSGASKVKICLKPKGDMLQLMISDNGKGIENDEVGLKKSLGLRIMRERIAALGGSFYIKGAKNKGTTINIEVPLKNTKL